VVLMSPISSAASVLLGSSHGSTAFAFTPLDIFRNYAKISIAHVRCPVCIMHGTEDQVSGLQV
jgi:hypothetical protein